MAATIDGVRVVEKDEIWSGETFVEGDLHISADATLTLLAGSVVRFSPNKAGKSSLIVHGLLRVRGTAQQPVSLSGDRWNGVYALENSELVLINCEMSAGVGSALSLHGRSRLRGRGLRASGVGSAICAVDGARASIHDAALISPADGVRWESTGRCALRKITAKVGATGIFASSGRLFVSESIFQNAKIGVETAGGRVRVRAARFIRCEQGVGVRRGTATVVRSHWEACGIGSLVRAGGRLYIAAAEVESVDAGVDSIEGAVKVIGSRFRGGRCAIRCDRATRLALRGCRFEDSQAGVELKNSIATLADSRFLRCMIGLSADGSSLRAFSCAWTDCETALRASAGSKVIVADCEFQALHEGASFTSARGRLIDCRFHGSPIGTRVGAGGRLILQGVTWSNCDVGLIGEEGASAALLRTTFKGGTQALSWSGRTLRLRSSVFESFTRGAMNLCGADRSTVIASGTKIRSVPLAVLLRGGRLRLQDSHFGPCSVAGITVDGGKAVATLERCTVSVAPVGADLRAGTLTLGNSVSFVDCGEPVREAPGSMLSFVDDSPLPELSGLRRAVLSLANRPSARSAFQLPYLTAERSLGAWAAVAGADGVKIHRGWRGPGWIPGISDLDSVWLEQGLEGPAGWRTTKRRMRFHRNLKSVFPFLGETLFATPADARVFAHSGNFRALNTLGVNIIDEEARRAEAFVGLTRAYESLFVRRDPSPVWRRHAFKAVADFLSGFDIPPNGAPLGRDEFARSIGKRDPMWSARWRRLESVSGSAENRSEELAELIAAAVFFADARLPPSVAPVARHGSGSGGAFVESLQRRFDGAVSGVLVDSLHRAVVIVDFEAKDISKFARGMAAWARVRQRQITPTTLPIFLTRRLWDQWVRLPYMEDPAPGAAAGGMPTSAGRLFGSHQRYSWGGFPEIASPRPDLIKRAAASFLMSWRWTAAASQKLSLADAHWLLSRLLGLRLYVERGSAPSFFDVDALIAAHARTFPETADAVARLEVAGDSLGLFATSQSEMLRRTLEEGPPKP